MTSHYETNAARLDRADDDANVWASVLDPYEVRQDVRNHLLGALMAQVDPADFALMVERAEAFAGKPDDYRDHGPAIWQ